MAMCRQWLTTTLLSLLALPVLAAISDDHGAADLPYREALYHHYQGDSLTALTTLAGLPASQSRAVDARLLEAGIRLGYGLNRSAQTLIAGLSSNQALSATQLAAARLYLARWLYRHGELTEASKVLSELSDQAMAGQTERHYLQQLVALQQGQTTVVADSGHSNDSWTPYLLFNRAQAQRLDGKPDAALNTLAQLLPILSVASADTQGFWQQLAFWRGWFGPSALPLAPAERLALLDKAWILQAEIYLSQAQYQAAMQAYQSVRLDADDSQEALMGYGLAALSAGDQALAVTVWKRLQQTGDLQPHLQPVWLALAWSFERNQMREHAFVAYQAAEQNYMAELDRLQKLAAQDLSALIGVLFSPDDSSQPLRQGPRDLTELPHGLLQEVVAQHATQNLLQDREDLLALQQHLGQWQQRLGMFTLMLETRQRAHQQRLAALAAQPPQQQLQQLQQQYRQLQGRLEQGDDPYLLANADEQEAIARLQRAQAVLVNMSGHKREASYRERLRRIQGVVQWQQHQVEIERRWALRKQLKQIERLNADNAGQLKRLQPLLAAPPDFASLQQRIAASEQRIVQLQQQVAKQLPQLDTQLEQILRGALSTQQAQLTQHLAQARLALTRLSEQFLTTEKRG